MENVLQKRAELIAQLQVNFGIKAVNIYLDARNDYKRKLREYYIKLGIKMVIDEMDFTYTFLSMFYRGYLEIDPYYENVWAAESVLHSFYVELMKIGQHLKLKQQILNILAVNGSKESEAYRLILNDKIARSKQEKLEENVKRVRR